jgi:hypothetical protein
MDRPRKTTGKKKTEKKTKTSNCECSAPGATPFAFADAPLTKGALSRRHREREKEMTEKGAEQTCDAKLVLLGNSGTRSRSSHHCTTGGLLDPNERSKRKEKKREKK